MGKFIAIAVIVIVALLKSCGGKSDEQKAYDALVERNRTLEEQNPGLEYAALKCMELADTQEKVGKERARNGLDTTGYTRDDAYKMCMTNKGYGHVLK